MNISSVGFRAALSASIPQVFHGTSHASAATPGFLAPLKADTVQFGRKQDLKTPSEIKKGLDEHVIGQDRAKRALAVAARTHTIRIENNSTRTQAERAGDTNRGNDADIEKSNVLLIGPTGVGKTLLLKTLAKTVDIPMAITNATSLTEAGYVGEDVENILLKLLQASDSNLQRAEAGLLYIDEIDKKSRKGGDNVSITRDVSGEGVQQALLKIVEGTIASIPSGGGRKHPQGEFIQMDTSNILFVAGGAFEGLEDIIRNRLKSEARGGSSSMGFGRNVGDTTENLTTSEVLRKVEQQDLVKYGLMPEFVGRFQIITTLDALEESDLARILREPRNSLFKQYQRLFKAEEVDLKFEDGAAEAIARKAIRLGTGARGLKGILDKQLEDILYELPDAVKNAKLSGLQVNKDKLPILRITAEMVEKGITDFKTILEMNQRKPTRLQKAS